MLRESPPPAGMTGAQSARPSPPREGGKNLGRSCLSAISDPSSFVALVRMVHRLFLAAVAATILMSSQAFTPPAVVRLSRAPSVPSIATPLSARKGEAQSPEPVASDGPLANLDDGQRIQILFSVVFIPVFFQAASKGQFAEFFSDPLVAVRAFGPWFAINAALNLATSGRRASADAGNK